MIQETVTLSFQSVSTSTDHVTTTAAAAEAEQTKKRDIDLLLDFTYVAIRKRHVLRASLVVVSLA
jgi:predicted Rossmann-fold nucleotide-binding protein